MPTLALVGAAHIHTPDFINRLNKRDAAQVKYVWDHDAARADAAAAKLGAQVAELEKIHADAEIEAVVVCTETIRHEEVVMPAIKAGKHLFVEKPLGFAAADAYRMAQAIKEADLLFQTGYFMRGQPIHLFLKEQVDKGHFGTITRVRHSNCHSGALGGWFDTDWRWMADPNLAGVGAFGDLGAHSLDILLWLFGEVDTVTASINTVTGRYENCDESGEGMLRFKNGAVGTLAAGWVDVADPVKLLISGTEGHTVVVEDTLYYKSAHVEGADGGAWRDLPEMLPHAFELFLDALEDKDVPLVDASEAAYRNAVMAALYEGSETTTWVTPRAIH
ncbi:Gfo/Idh/MocA family oxidoreductase [soil metagenome]